MKGAARAEGRRQSAGDEVGEVLDSIRRIVRLLASRQADRDFGLSGAQVFVLQTLAEAEMLSVNELAECSHTHQSSVSVVVQSLVDKRFIARAHAAEELFLAEDSQNPV